MAMAFGEWTRKNGGIADRVAYEDYLEGLARAAQRANASPGPRTIENVLSRSLEGYDDIGSLTPSMVADVLAGLEEAGYVITDARSHVSREAVSDALNEAANVLSEHEEETTESILLDDTVNLLVSFTLHLLDHPGDSVEDAIIAQYADVTLDSGDLDEGEEMPEKGSERWNELLVERVLGWIS